MTIDFSHVRISLDSPEGGSGQCLVIECADAPGLFSILSGLLAAFGFDIISGDITTTAVPDSDRRHVRDTIRGTIEGVDDESGRESWIELVGPILDQSLALLYTGDTRGARAIVLNEVAQSLSRRNIRPTGLLGPISVEIIKQAPKHTILDIASSDTPFFLHAVSSALALHGVNIEGIDIQTHEDHVHDRFIIANTDGSVITDDALLNRIRLSAVLTKQFTCFLDRAPDPVRALDRFDTLIQDLVRQSNADQLAQRLSSPTFQQELARLLGTSDFIWEDFLRVQQDNLLPIFTAMEDHQQLSLPRDQVEEALRSRVAEGATLEEKKFLLNEFKDRQSFLIDLDHILIKDLDFFFLSRRLSALAEAVVRQALDLAREELQPVYGTPRTAAGIEAEWTVCGLGKLGGRAIGFASDIELMYLWADDGETDGRRSTSNREYFERFFKLATSVIQSRREGIFEVDLRLRPFGEDGPIAVKLERFIEYFSKSGKAHSAERLALVRLRHIGGSQRLGERVISIRDSIIYESDAIDIPALRDLRRHQIEHKVEAGRTNAKFSPGGLVDLEYNVQILQVMHGRAHPELRVSGIHDGLRILSEMGTIEEGESEAMVASYRFLRNLINGLRMLRGNAQDLVLPDHSSLEYQHLARRLGYENQANLNAGSRLRLDVAENMARVRSFVERHLGRDAIPTSVTGNPADLVLSDSLDMELSTKLLSQAGFRNPERTMVNIRSMAGHEQGQRALFARLLVLAWPELRSCPDPDMAINNWERLVRRLDDAVPHYEQLLSQPRRLDLLIRLVSSSQFLADTLTQHPDFFRWITDPEVVSAPRTQVQMEQDLRREAQLSRDRTDWLNRLRRFRKREILRIGLRDLGLARRIEEIMGEISFLARAIIEVGLEQAWKRIESPGIADPSRLCVLAFGKLGGWELNYSSDIDILGIYRPAGETREGAEEKTYTQVFKALFQDLSDFTAEGQAYRVDLRLRPYGSAGPLVSSMGSILTYYRETAALWEWQALIKLKPVAGALDLGEEFLEASKPGFIQRWDPPAVRISIKKLREQAVSQHTRGLGDRFEVKNGEGGIRDIEFLVQGLQMIHSRDRQQLLTSNTLYAIRMLTQEGIIGKEDAEQIVADYKLLRRIEHYLQLYEDRQLHALPEAEEDKTKLALSLQQNPHTFFGELAELRKRVRSKYTAFLEST